MVTDTATAGKPAYQTTLTRYDLYAYSSYWIYFGVTVFLSSVISALNYYFGEAVSWGFIAIVAGAVVMCASYKYTRRIPLEMAGFVLGMLLILLGIVGPIAVHFGADLAMHIGLSLSGIALMLYGWRSRIVANRPID